VFRTHNEVLLLIETTLFNRDLDDQLSTFAFALGIKPKEVVQWTYWGAVFYCGIVIIYSPLCASVTGTVITTIGYGNMYPVSNTGQLLTIVYAMVGIPLTLYVLASLGKQCRMNVRSRSASGVAPNDATVLKVHTLSRYCSVLFWCM
jgi:hypothetical protein